MPELINRIVALPAIQAAALGSAFNAACVILGAEGRAELAKLLKSIALRDRGNEEQRFASPLVPDFMESVQEAILVIGESLDQADWDGLGQ